MGRIKSEHKEAALELIAAGYTWASLNRRLMERGFRPIKQETFNNYCKIWGEAIIQRRQERYDSILNTGLAIVEERVKRLMEFAEELEPRRLEVDEHGKYQAGALWRELVKDIASETGGRQQKPQGPASVTAVVVHDAGRKVSVSPGARVRELPAGNGKENDDAEEGEFE